ncbi:MAG: DUF881 domain-containing protein [Candidatus Gastranaerophilaceae bacterium]|jgi:uncharacterized protein YlxW (UPF0749 family)
MEMDLKDKIGYFLSIGFLALIVSFIISSQVKDYLGYHTSEAVFARKFDSLVLILKETKNKNEKLNDQLKALKSQLNKLNSSQIKHVNFTPELKRAYEEAGLTPYRGRGIVLIIDDTALFNHKELNYENLLHSDDLLKIVNVLKASGAKAITVNNQRLVTISEIVTADNAIVINRTKMAPPYVIKVIGPQNAMISSLNIRGGIAEYLDVFGIKLKIQKSNNLVIAPYKKKI